MKNTYIILILLFFSYGVFAQETTHLKVVNIENNGVTIIEAKESYLELSDYGKSSAIRMLLSNTNHNSLIAVDYGHTREMWKRDMTTGQFVRFDILNIDDPDLQRFVNKSKHPEKFSKHPWFLNWGFSGTFDDNDEELNYNFFGNIRGGFFLLANKWDIALSVMLGGNKKDDFFMSVGLISKVYFPIKKIGLSPYVGAGVSYNFTMSFAYNSAIESDDSKSHYIDVPVTAGISWRLGPGSLDIGFQYGLRSAITKEHKNSYMGIIGYTFCPWAKRK